MMSFCFRFITKRDFDCEQVEQQTSQSELKQCFSCLTFRNHAFILVTVYNVSYIFSSLQPT